MMCLTFASSNSLGVRNSWISKQTETGGFGNTKLDMSLGDQTGSRNWTRDILVHGMNGKDVFLFQLEEVRVMTNLSVTCLQFKVCLKECHILMITLVPRSPII